MFLESVLDNAKYRQQMLCLVKLKVEAYSILDLVLFHLWEYKKNQSVDKRGGGGTVKKGENKLIFDANILALPNPTVPLDSLIAPYIIERIASKLSFSALPNGFPSIQQIPASNKFQHGDLTVQCDVEDLSARIPMSNLFNKTAKGLVIETLDRLPSNYDKFKNNIKDFIRNDNTFTKWSTVEFVALSGDSSGGKSHQTFDVEPLKEWFIVEPYIVNAIVKKDKPFKINLLTAPTKILEAISHSHGNLKIPDSRQFNDKEYDPLISNGGVLELYCSKEIQFFTVKVCVSTSTGNSHIIRCICDATSNPIRNQRLPFNIIKIEEF
jgi:hypothetical protein